MDTASTTNQDLLLFSFAYTSNGLSDPPSAEVAVHVCDAFTNRQKAVFYGHTPFLDQNDFVITRDILRHHLYCYPTEMVALEADSLDWSRLTPDEAMHARMEIDSFLLQLIRHSETLGYLPWFLHWEHGTYVQLKKKASLRCIDKSRPQESFTYWLIDNAFSVPVEQVFGLVVAEIMERKGVISSLSARLHFQLPCAVASGNATPAHLQSVATAVAQRTFATSTPPAVPFIDRRARTPCAATRLYAIKAEAYGFFKELTVAARSSQFVQAVLGPHFSAISCARESHRWLLPKPSTLL